MDTTNSNKSCVEVSNHVYCGKVTAFIDIQGFHDNKNEPIVKEFSYTFAHSQTEPKHFIFKPPYRLIELREDKRDNVRYRTRFHHGLLWNEGELNYKRLNQCLNLMLYDNDIEQIYVQGKEQIMWLYQLFSKSAKPLPPIFDVFFMPSLDSGQFKQRTEHKLCASKNHDWSFNEGAYDFWGLYTHPKNCALQNVLILKDYYTKHIEEFSIFRKNKDMYEEYEQI